MKKSKRNDVNFNPKKVIYCGETFETGNRKNNLIELFKGKKFVKVVKMSDVQPINDFQIKILEKLKRLKSGFFKGSYNINIGKSDENSNFSF